MKRSALVLVLLVTIAATIPAQIRVNTSHSGAVRVIRHDTRTGFLFTAGDDGKLKVWGTADTELKQSIQISHLPIQQLALHPREPQVAVVISDGRRRFSLEVWDWQQGRRLFSHNLGESPIFLDYSPMGTFLLYAQNDLNSLRFLAAATGRSLPYLRRGFGIVTFATVASSEERIMTYTPSDGTITYWELTSARQVQTATTATDLDHLVVLTNRRFAAGRLDNELVIVDIVDGTIRDRYPMSNIERIMVNPLSAEIAVLTRSGRQTDVSYFMFDRNRLDRVPRTAPGLPANFSALIFHGTSLVAAAADGSIYSYATGSRVGTTIARNQVAPVTGFAFTGETVHVSTTDRIISMASDLFGSNEIPVNRVQRLDVTTRVNPLSAAVRLSTVQRGDSTTEDVLVWDTSGRDARVSFFRPAERAFQILPLSEHRATKQIQTENSRLLILHDHASMSRVDLETLTTNFTYTGEGMETIAAVGNTVVIGKNRLNPFDSSLMRVDTRTGETVRVQSDSFLVFDLVYDRQRQLLYSLGLQQTGNSVRTTVTLHRGSNFENRRIIATYDGEDLDARLTLDPSNGNLYMSLGMEAVTVWDGRRTAVMPSAGHVARALFVANRHLFAINRDGTVSVWNLGTREPMMTLYVFTDAHWAALSADGHYFVSHPDAERHLSYVAQPGRVFRQSSLRDYRLILPTDSRNRS